MADLPRQAVPSPTGAQPEGPREPQRHHRHRRGGQVTQVGVAVPRHAVGAVAVQVGRHAVERNSVAPRQRPGHVGDGLQTLRQAIGPPAHRQPRLGHDLVEHRAGPHRPVRSGQHRVEELLVSADPPAGQVNPGPAGEADPLQAGEPTVMGHLGARIEQGRLADQRWGTHAPRLEHVFDSRHRLSRRPPVTGRHGPGPAPSHDRARRGSRAGAGSPRCPSRPHAPAAWPCPCRPPAPRWPR